MTEPIGRIRTELQDIRPTIWREVDAPLASTLRALHGIIQVSLGWNDSHLFEFRAGGRRYGRPHPDFGFKVYSAKNIRVQPLVDRGIRNFTCLYDFGDYWKHDIAVTELLAGKPHVEYPAFVDGARRCPPDDVGGVAGFAEFLEAIRNPRHERHEELVSWHESLYWKRFDANDIEVMRVHYGLAEIARRRRRSMPSHRRRR